MRLKEGSQILLETSELQPRTGKPQKYPVLFTYRYNEIKHLVLAASDFGFWHFQLQEDPIRDQFFYNFIERAIRWLVNRDDINQIQIQSVQRSYNLGEQVIFAGQVYDEFYSPIIDAEVKINVSGNSVDISDEMDIQSGGYYRYSLGGLPEGEFQYKITAQKNDRNIGARFGKISVNPFYLEFQQISSNVPLMEQLAGNTGGEIFRPREFVQKFGQLSFKNRVYFSFSEYFLWSYIHWLLVLIALLAIEWFLRKRWGLL
jgi:hypothetical protein